MRWGWWTMNRKATLTRLEIYNYLVKRAKGLNRNQRKSLLLLANEVKRHRDIEYNICITKYGYNLGDIAECLLLDMFGLKVEDDDHEIKSFILNHWNILKDNHRQTCYILNTYSKHTGIYKCNAELIRNKVISNKKSLERLLEKCTLIKAL